MVVVLLVLVMVVVLVSSDAGGGGGVEFGGAATDGRYGGGGVVLVSVLLMLLVVAWFALSAPSSRCEMNYATVIPNDFFLKKKFQSLAQGKACAASYATASEPVSAADTTTTTSH